MRNRLQAGLSIAGFACHLLCGSWWVGDFDGVYIGERMPDGRYVIHRLDMPEELSTGHATISVEDTIKARQMRTHDRAWLRKKPDGTWTVEARE